MTYYNEREPYAVAWLRNLAAAGHVAPGEVDGRSITEVKASELSGQRQSHFFAGLGGWSRALRLAGVSDAAPIWTGSCPCQPFSQAGQKAGADDERHLWPVWFSLIGECRPPIIFGEQVSSPGGLAWLDAVSHDLEGAGYSVGAADLCAAGLGAPHIRQRLWFVAVANDYKDGRALLGPSRIHEGGESGNNPAGRGKAGGVADRGGNGLEGRHGGRPTSAPIGGPGEVPYLGVGDAGIDGVGEHPGELPGEVRAAYGGDAPVPPGAVGGYWERADWLWCRDSKWRPVEPGTFPLAHGATARVGRLRAYGNAIVAPLAATFIRSALECL